MRMFELWENVDGERRLLWADAKFGARLGFRPRRDGRALLRGVALKEMIGLRRSVGCVPVSPRSRGVRPNPFPTIEVSGEFPVVGVSGATRLVGGDRPSERALRAVQEKWDESERLVDRLVTMPLFSQSAAELQMMVLRERAGVQERFDEAMRRLRSVFTREVPR